MESRPDSSHQSAPSTPYPGFSAAALLDQQRPHTAFESVKAHMSILEVLTPAQTPPRVLPPLNIPVTEPDLFVPATSCDEMLRALTDRPSTRSSRPEWWDMPRQYGRAADSFDQTHGALSHRAILSLQGLERDVTSERAVRPSSNLRLPTTITSDIPTSPPHVAGARVSSQLARDPSQSLHAAAAPATARLRTRTTRAHGRPYAVARP